MYLHKRRKTVLQTHRTPRHTAASEITLSKRMKYDRYADLSGNCFEAPGTKIAGVIWTLNHAPVVDHEFMIEKFAIAPSRSNGGFSSASRDSEIGGEDRFGGRVPDGLRKKASGEDEGDGNNGGGQQSNNPNGDGDGDGDGNGDEDGKGSEDDEDGISVIDESAPPTVPMMVRDYYNINATSNDYYDIEGNAEYNNRGANVLKGSPEPSTDVLERLRGKPPADLYDPSLWTPAYGMDELPHQNAPIESPSRHRDDIEQKRFLLALAGIKLQ